MTDQPKNHTLFGSMHFRALMFLSAVALVITLTLAGIWKSSLHDVFEDYANRWSRHHLSMLSATLVPLLLQKQQSAVRDTMEAALADEETWKTLRLLDSDGVQLFPTGKVRRGTAGKQIRIVHTITDRDRNLGTIILTADLGEIQSNVLRVSYIFVACALFGVLLIVICTAGMFEAFVLKPLRGLSKAADAVALGDYSHQLPSSNDGTINQLIANFSAMRTAIKQHARGLYEAKVTAEEASKAKSVFVASIGHELRTPLNGMLGMAHLLEDSPLDDSQRQQVALITYSGNTLLSLLDEILELTRIEENNLTMKTSDFDLSAVLQDAFDSWGPRARAKGLAFTIDDREIFHHMLSGDVGRLSQVVDILLGNSLKFTLKGEIGLRITQARDADDGITTRFEISDTGIGIAAASLPSLFKNFTQADNREARRYDGAGLGLAVAKGVADQMGGEVGVTSVENEGSTFWFSVTLPRASETGQTPPRVEFFERNDNPPAETSDFRRLQILVAEDNHVNQQVIRGMLERSGHEITTVENGAQAVRAVSAGHFDLVLMDINMPEMSGLEATRRIRALPDERSQVPIIAVTANTAKCDRDKYLREGMTGYVPKPIEAKRLADAIETAVGQAVQVDSIAGFEEFCVFETTPELENDINALFESIDATLSDREDAPNGEASAKTEARTGT